MPKASKLELRKATLEFIKELKGDIRLHITNDENLSLNVFEEVKQKIDDKPTGLWYGIGDSWIQWCNEDMPQWFCTHIYEIELNENKILKIDNLLSFEKFEETYQDNPLTPVKFYNFIGHINYERLSQKYSGIEISPYFWDKTFSSHWYYCWDCASGCIWNKNCLEDLRLLAFYDEKTDSFIKTDLQTRKNKV